MTARPSDLFIITLLGVLNVISPFAIDMYLPGFTQIAHEYNVPSAVVSLTLSSYFIGLAFGQVIYGPLLDRYGRKKPLMAGLVLFIVASFACMYAPSIYWLIALRFVQALGGCAAQVSAVAMVRDFFHVKESAKILSLMFLFIAVSPLLAPSIGSMLMLAVSWQAIFMLLAGIIAMILLLVYFYLPEAHIPDPGIDLNPVAILKEYAFILKHPKFATYAISGAFSFAGLFTYVAGSPIIFMEGFHLSATAYSAIFAGLSVGFIGCSQLNVWLLRRYELETLFLRALVIQTAAGLVFVIGAAQGWWGLRETLVLFFIFLSCAGLTYPNAAALALSPFSRNAGSASALLGFLQLGVGSFISTGISFSASRESLPIIAIMAITASIGFVILLIGRKRAATCSIEN